MNCSAPATGEFSIKVFGLTDADLTAYSSLFFRQSKWIQNKPSCDIQRRLITLFLPLHNKNTGALLCSTNYYQIKLFSLSHFKCYSVRFQHLPQLNHLDKIKHETKWLTETIWWITFRIGDINTDSPVRMNTNTPVTLCSLQTKRERNS